ncbi:MAG: CotH kinase family protein [Verrucomicrobia bacterium]|nr:CotH kinase family protein [Verrucomicrobiota bacterium]MBI3868892.1 CotH kinase family protein [Verrucomicrobiota bacterium]
MLRRFWTQHSLKAGLRALLLSGLCGWAIPSPGYEAKPIAGPHTIRSDEADPFFQGGLIPTMQIRIDAAGMDHLRKSGREYVKATVIEGARTYLEVGVHLKGAAGSYRPVDDQPALTLNFDKFKPGQTFHGLEKLHLNNSVQDSSYITELLCGELFLASGVPAARTTHAIVELNGRKLGLYVLKEGFGKQFLRRHFSNPKGNLYDGGFLRDINETMQRISGDEGDGQPAAEALVKACAIQDPAARMAALEKRLDLDRFVSFIAMEMMVWHWDGYLMKRNNYRLYHDVDSNRAVFFPHGMDQMFWNPTGRIPPGAEGMVAQAVLSSPAGAELYRNRIAWLTTNVFLAEALTNRIHQVHQRLRPVLASIDPERAAQHDASVRNLTRQVAQRAAFLQRKFGEGDQKPLAFDARGEAPLKGWRSRVDGGEARFQQSNESGRRIMGIEAIEPPARAAESKPAAASAPNPQPSTAAAQPKAPEKPADPALGSCLASYRISIPLPPGRYALIGRVRTEGVQTGGKLVRGSGAGLRVSQRSRQNALQGDTDWQELSFEFRVEEGQDEAELVCDLRARRGRALFDADSLRLKRLPDGN